MVGEYPSPCRPIGNGTRDTRLSFAASAKSREMTDVSLVGLAPSDNVQEHGAEPVEFPECGQMRILPHPCSKTRCVTGWDKVKLNQLDTLRL